MIAPRIPQYKAAGYVEGFEDKAQELFSRCFGGRKFDTEVWDWQFNSNPYFNRRVTTLWDEDTLIAMTALTPSFALVDGREVVSAVSGTTMARDDYRGVSIQLVSECGKQNRDIEFKYSFPNRQAFRIATKFYGHHYVGDVAFWTARPRRLPRDERVSKFELFTTEHGDLYRGVADAHSYMKRRDKDYLNWRFVQKPRAGYGLYEYADYGVSGYVVVNEYREGEESHLQIVDIVANSEEAFACLMQHAINLAYENGDDIVKLWLTSRAYKRTLEGMGFAYGMQPFRVTVWDRDIDLEDAYITMSDSDVF